MMLDKTFYTRQNVVEIAQDLIGKIICTQINGILTCARIVETEAYSYQEKACHAYNNRLTERTKIMFGEGGTSYIYLCYGIHELFNIVTNTNGTAEAVLIRGVEPLQGVDLMVKRRNFDRLNSNLTSGPGKLTIALGIGRALNGIDLLGEQIWLEKDDFKVEHDHINRSPRIGVGYAEEDAHLPWRFYLDNNPYVSKGKTNYS